MTSVAHCAVCRRKQERTRGSSDQRGLGADHRRIREQVLAEEKSCWICGGHGTADDPLTADHVVARSDGGRNVRSRTSSHELGQAVDVTDYGTFGRIMAKAPAWERLFNRLGAADPVHFSVTGYDKGGWLPQGLSLALNNTGRPERVGGGGGHTYNVTNIFPGYVGDESVVAAVVRDAMESFQNRNGRPAFGTGF